MLHRLFQLIGIKLPPDPNGIDHPDFVDSVRKALDQGTSLVAEQALDRCGGAKLYCLLRQWSDFQILLADSPARTSLSVYFPPALPIRGNADSQLKREMIQLLKRLHDDGSADDGVDLIRMDAKQLYLGEEDMDYFETVDEISTWFDANVGVPILAGALTSPWREVDRVVTASVPDSDGKDRPGAG
jgi:hypothetical protein